MACPHSAPLRPRRQRALKLKGQPARRRPRRLHSWDNASIGAGLVRRMRGISTSGATPRHIRGRISAWVLPLSHTLDISWRYDGQDATGGFRIKPEFGGGIQVPHSKPSDPWRSEKLITRSCERPQAGRRDQSFHEAPRNTRALLPAQPLPASPPCGGTAEISQIFSAALRAEGKRVKVEKNKG